MLCHPTLCVWFDTNLKCVSSQAPLIAAQQANQSVHLWQMWRINMNKASAERSSYLLKALHRGRYITLLLSLCYSTVSSTLACWCTSVPRLSNGATQSHACTQHHCHVASLHYQSLRHHHRSFSVVNTYSLHLTCSSILKIVAWLDNNV